MLNTDYKILSKALVLRVQPILQYIIIDDQTGFMRGRSISTNIHKTIEIISYDKEQNYPGIIMSIDFEKCFDRIEIFTIQGALRYSGFGENYICWVYLLFNHFQLPTQNNGNASEWFTPTWGCHQGCCLAPFLYLLCGELLAHKIKENMNIKGIPVYDLVEILSQFADDAMLYLTFDTLTLQSVVETLSMIEQNCGLKVNYNKTNLYQITSLVNSTVLNPLPNRILNAFKDLVQEYLRNGKKPKVTLQCL